MTSPVTDLHSKILNACPLPIFFIFMQFSVKFGQTIAWRLLPLGLVAPLHVWEILDPPLFTLILGFDLSVK